MDTSIGHRMHKKRIDVACTVLNDVWPNRDHSWVSMWGANKTFDSSYMILVDESVLKSYPVIKGDSTSKSLHLLLNGASTPKTPRPTSLTIITWNVNSLRQRLKHVLGLLTIEEPTILFLQETKLEDGEFAKITWPSNYHVVHTGMQRFNGVATLSTIEPTSLIVLRATADTCKSPFNILSLSMCTYTKDNLLDLNFTKINSFSCVACLNIYVR